MITEEWRPIPWAGGKYEVSDLGRVRSVIPRRSRVLSTPANNHGYLQVTVCVDGRKLNRRVHQLVAEAFHGSRPDGLVIRHLDGDKMNNRATNLRYGTSSENAQDRLEHGRHHQLEKMHCPQGHAYDAANTRINVSPRGDVSRRCRACHRASQAARWRAKHGGVLIGGSGALQRSKTHCPSGHSYDDRNTYRAPDGKRYCRVCRRAATARYDARRKTA